MCGNCGRPREGARGVCTCIPAWVWQDTEVTAAVRDHDAQRVIQVLRRRVPELSQEALARMCGVAQSTITRAQAGVGLTDRRKAVEALRGLGAPTRLNSSARRAPQPDERHSPAGPGALAHSASAGATQLWHQVSESSEGDAVRAFRLADRQSGGGHLYAMVMRFLSHRVGPALVSEAGTPATFVAAAGLTEMAGWMAHDAGRDDVAAGHFHRAVNLARAGEADALVAQVWASRAHLSLCRGDSNAARTAAEQAWRHLDGSEDTALRGRVLAMLTRAHAAHGDTTASRAALRQAEHLLSVPPSVPRSEWTSPFDLGSLTGEAARSMCNAGDFTAASEFARQALQLRSPERVRARALAHLTLTRALLGQGRVGEAAAATGKAQADAAVVDSAVVRSQLRGVATQLAAHRAAPEVATVLDKVSRVLVRPGPGGSAEGVEAP